MFVHDCYRGQGERRFLEEFVPGAFFSDDPRFEEAFSHLDESIFEMVKREGLEGWQLHWFQDTEQESYGPTYACLPHVKGARYGRLLRRMILSKTASRLGRSFRKRLGR